MVILEKFMPSYSLAETKSQLTRIVREVEAGARVTLTRNGRPVAELSPPTSRLLSGDKMIAAARKWGGWDKPLPVPDDFDITQGLEGLD
jgi:prevent-host-death family protein